MSRPGVDPCQLEMRITLELAGGWVIGGLAIAALIETIGNLEHDGIHPYRTTIEVVETPTA